MSRNRALYILPVLLAAACSGGGSTPPTAPTIQALSLTPRALYASATPVTFQATFDFSDPNGDVASATVVVTDDVGTEVLRQTVVVPAAGIVAAQATGGAVAAMPNVGTFTMTLFVTDATGRRSNELTETIAVTPYPWAQLSPHPLLLFDAAAVGLDHRLYVLGGHAFGQGGRTNSVGVYDPAADSWSAVAPLPAARESLAAAALDGRIYAIGGVGVTG